MFGGSIDLWKLNSLEDYLAFFAMILAGVVVFGLMIRKISRNRTDSSAHRKVMRRLSKLVGGKGIVCENMTLDLAGEPVHFDSVLIDSFGVVLVRSYGWGTKVYGQLGAPTWKLMHLEESREIDNPLLAVEAMSEPLRRRLAAANVHGVPLQGLAVFADPFQTPELYLGRTSEAVSLQALKSWYKNRRLSRAMAATPAEVRAVLEAARAQQSATELA